MKLNYLVFASANRNKVDEVEAKLGGILPLKSLTDIGCLEEIPETAPTLQGNAQQKARYVFERFGENCFADDTGLEVEALNGQPGVLSARFAGPEKNPEKNMEKLLSDLGDTDNRNARFRTVICLIIDGKEILFEGIVNGTIAKTKSGAGGFGYDPLFIPVGHSRSFAEMSMEEKNLMSHRGKAIAAMQEFLNSYRD